MKFLIAFLSLVFIEVKRSLSNNFEFRKNMPFFKIEPNLVIFTFFYLNLRIDFKNQVLIDYRL
jgi:hypothetical protein